MAQSRKESFIEATLNTMSGFLISLAVWILVVKPIYNIDTNFIENFSITCIFTVTSLLRSYVVRRYCDNHLHLLVLWISDKLKRVFNI